jgi:hypothetical protein
MARQTVILASDDDYGRSNAMDDVAQTEMESVETLARQYARALRVWLPDGTPTDYEQLVRNGGSRGALVKISGLIESVMTQAPLPDEKQEATKFIIKIERLGAATRAAVDDATLAFLLGEKSNSLSS